MNHQFDLLENVFDSDSFITSDAYLQHTLNCERCIYYRSDAVFRSKTWRGKKVRALLSGGVEKKANLVLGHSDQYTGVVRALLLRSLGFSKIFGINVCGYRNISFPIPIGVTNNTNESEYHRLFGNNGHFMLANEEEFLKESNGKVYGCFSTETNLSERLPLVEILSKGNHTFEIPEFSVSGRIKYLQNLRKYAFTACPVGNGVDTHRLWEVLYMGGIPIIKKDKLLESLLVDLPFVLVENWNQINDSEFLQDSWDALSNKRNYKFEKLSVDYWIDKMHQS